MKPTVTEKTYTNNRPFTRFLLVTVFSIKMSIVLKGCQYY
nr:MAG TPA: hypothetical protein [Caudoviricetes sp.]